MNGKHFEEVYEYARLRADKKIPACKEVIQACQRFILDLDNTKWEFRSKDADFVVGIIERTFKHRKGEALDGTPLRGKPFLLLPWQKFIVYNLLGFYKADTNERRFKEAFIFVPRKNGKTIFISALAWAVGLLQRKSGSTVYVVAAVLKEAMQAFENWRYNIASIWYRDAKEAKNDGWRILDNNMEHSISNDELDGGSLHLEALAGNPDAQDSFNCNFAIADEVHAYKTPKKYNIIKEAMKAYTNKLMVGITTAGDNPTGFCAKRLKYCQKILDGLTSQDAEAYFVFISKADQNEKGEVNYTDPLEHEKANPSYGITIRPDDMMNSALQAQNDPQQRKDFYAKELNIFTSAMKAYFNLNEFEWSNKQCEKELGLEGQSVAQKIAALAKLKISWFGGADLSKLHDLTAGALYGTYGDMDIIISHAWFPIVAAYLKAEEDGIPLFGWKDEGWLTMSNNPTVNHAEVVKWFQQMQSAGFKIQQVGHDRKFCKEYFLGMKKAGFKVIDQPQYFYLKSQGFRHIETKAKDGKLYYLGSEAFEYCLSNVHAIEKTDDMIQYEKIEPEQRIDVFDASVFACVRMLESLEKIQDARKWMEE